MHFEILRINNLKRAEQRKMREYKQSALANRISGSRLDAIFKITNPKKKKKIAYLENQEIRMQTYLWKLQVTTAQVMVAHCLWLAVSCANVQGALLGVTLGRREPCAGAAHLRGSSSSLGVDNRRSTSIGVG